MDLVVDGDLWNEAEAEVIDDWPLHKVAGTNSKLSVGACWEGALQTYKHQLNGYLAGLWYLPGHKENEEVMKCLFQCAESLQIPTTSKFAKGLQMLSNDHGSKVVIKGPSIQGTGELIRQVAYLNTREFPSPGRRLLTLDTKVTCSGGKTVVMPKQTAIVNVVAVQEPTIQISGTKSISREHEDFKLGVRVFADVHIVMTTGSVSTGEPVNGIENRLDECHISISPDLNGDHETISVPNDLMSSMGIRGNVSLSGADFTGAEMIYNYERLLRQVTYTNQKPAYYLSRQFKIVCSEMSGRFVSNHYIQTLNVIHPATNEAEVKPVAHQHVAPPDSHRSIVGYGVEEGGFKTFAIGKAHSKCS